MRNGGLIGGSAFPTTALEAGSGEQQNHVGAMMNALRNLERVAIYAEDVLAALTNGPRQINAANKATDKAGDPCLIEILNQSPEAIRNQANRIETAIEAMKQALRI